MLKFDDWEMYWRLLKRWSHSFLAKAGEVQFKLFRRPKFRHKNPQAKNYSFSQSPTIDNFFSKKEEKTYSNFTAMSRRCPWLRIKKDRKERSHKIGKIPMRSLFWINLATKITSSFTQNLEWLPSSAENKSQKIN